MKHFSKDERRRQLIKAAIEAFGRRGYHRTQVSDIIEEAGVARGTFYLYFEGKREIFDAIMLELFGRVREEVRTLPRDAVMKIPTQLRGNIERVTDLLLKNSLLAKILFNEAVGLDPELDKRLRNFYGQLLDLIQRGLNQGQEMGFVREGNVEVMAIALLGAFKEIFYQSLIQRKAPEKNIIVEEIYRLVISAIAKPGIMPLPTEN
ncbi:MAG: TetR/AcrR family transcriptional regulator [Deltaproteobacteria bacterium]|nr:TetR/AcrR family transcriptional regulator [Deltaproteobacteria bacterium]